jgi:glyoxylase-like metal-dependent hydrolase (beta-lactamase superfamily II)
LDLGKMKLTAINTGYFKLDGGAMFGVVPKRLWNRMQPADADNLCTWALRCLLIEHNDRKILVDTGIGFKQGEKFRSHFYPHEEVTLADGLAKHGLLTEDITDVFLTHFHFDHVGGAVAINEKGALVPTFPNATYWSNQLHYNWAFEPNDREKASFLKENFVPLQESGVLKMIPVEDGYEWLPGFTIRFSYCHTEAMMVLQINTGQDTIVFCADLLPSSFHIRMPYVMGYDIRPLETLKEKARLFEDAMEGNWILFLEHDPGTECIRIGKDDRERYVITERGALEELLTTS